MAGAAPQDVKLEFGRRKRKRFNAFLLTAALVVALLVLEQVDLSPAAAALTIAPLIAILLGICVYIFRVWRCPACCRYLGARYAEFGGKQLLRSCPKCHAELV